MIEQFDIRTNAQTEFIEISNQVKQIIKKTGVTDGICHIFIPHTTAAVTINENADPDVVSDMIMELNKIVPHSDNYKHFEGNSAAHIKSSLIGFSEIIFINGGKPVLGTWQGIYFCEFDGPRNRKVMVRID